MNIKKIIVTMVALLVISNGASTYACSCMMPESPEKELERSSNVFIGRVLSIKKEKGINELLGGMQKNSVTFEVKADIKGTKQNGITLTTAESSAACGYNFQEKKEYIVYANSYDGETTASLCSRTRLVENASEDLEAFEELILTNQKEDEEKDESVEINGDKIIKISTTSYVLITILVILILGIIIKSIKNKKD